MVGKSHIKFYADMNFRVQGGEPCINAYAQPHMGCFRGLRRPVPYRLI